MHMLAMFLARFGQKHHGTWENHKGTKGKGNHGFWVRVQRSWVRVLARNPRRKIWDFTIYTPQTRLVLETEVGVRTRTRARSSKFQKEFGKVWGKRIQVSKGNGKDSYLTPKSS